MTPDEANQLHRPLSATAPGTPEAVWAAQEACLEQRSFPVWAIYDNPSDLPGLFVARLHIATLRGAYVTTFAVTGKTLAEVRAALPPGLFRQDRQDDDDPKIMETWI